MVWTYIHTYRKTPKLGKPGTLLSWDGRRGWSQFRYTPSPHVLPHQIWYFCMKILMTVYCMHKMKWTPKIGERWGIGTAPCGRAWLTTIYKSCLEINLLPMCYPVGRSRSHGTSVIKEICLKIWRPLHPAYYSRSSEPIDTDRSATYFLLTLHSNRWPNSYHLRYKWRFQWKKMHFPISVYFVPLKGFPVELGIVPALGVKKN